MIVGGAPGVEAGERARLAVGVPSSDSPAMASESLVSLMISSAGGRGRGREATDWATRTSSSDARRASRGLEPG